MKALWLVAALSAAGISIGPARAHSLAARQADEARAVVIGFYYADGAEMAYGRVEVFAPDTQTPFAGGRADRLGRFAFVPDAPGVWRVNARDEEGHVVATTVAVEGDVTQPSRWQPSRTWLLVASVTVNLVIFALALGRWREKTA